MHFRNFNVLIAVQEASIVTHDIELEKLKLQLHIEDTSTDIVAQLGSSRWELFDVFIKKNSFWLLLVLLSIVMNYSW